MSLTPKEFQSKLRTIAKGKHGSKDLLRAEAFEMLYTIFTEEISPVMVGSFLTAMRFKGANEEELSGFLDAVEKSSIAIDWKIDGLLNVNGPYDGRSSSLNLSVAASLVAASAGVPVLLHSAFDMTPKKGVTSGEVMEELGIPSMLSLDSVFKQLKKYNISFLHNSKFMTGMGRLRLLREQLLFRTVLHTLEVINNPARAPYSIIGLAHDYFCEKFAKVQASRGVRHVVAIPGLDGADEAPMKKVMAYEVRDGAGSALELDPARFGFSYSEKRKAENVSTTAKITEDILAGEKGESLDSVIYNAGLRIYIGGKAKNLPEGILAARDLIESGKVIEKLNSMRVRDFL